MRIQWLRVLSIGLLVNSVFWSGGCAASSSESSSYGVSYLAQLRPATGDALVSIRVDQETQLLGNVDFSIDAAQLEFLVAEGDVKQTRGRLQWIPPATGGTLQFRATIDHLRSGTAYDALMTPTWALFRADDLFPAARTVTVAGATSRARLRIDAPEGWSVVTPYGRGQGAWFSVANPRRRFDRPTGWIVAGELGVRTDDIGPTHVVVAAPIKQGMRRIDVLALLRWTLPELNAIFGPLPSPLTIVGAGDPMWRGGLSARSSLFLHSGRPLISENGTSTLVHELVHIALNRDGADWLVEGLAEYYALEALHRSGTISDKRYAAAHDDLAEWGQSASGLSRTASRGAATALAVRILRELNDQVEAATQQERNLDDVLSNMSDDPLGLDMLIVAAERTTGQKLSEFAKRVEALLGD